MRRGTGSATSCGPPGSPHTSPGYRAGAVAVFTDPADLLARWDDSPLKGS